VKCKRFTAKSTLSISAKRDADVNGADVAAWGAGHVG